MEVTKLYYTIGEVAEILEVNVSLVRFWSNNFSAFIKPKRNKKGNRLFSGEDLEIFGIIHYLVKERGLTIEGTKIRLKEKTDNQDNKFEILNKLRLIKAKLKEVHQLITINNE